MSTQKLTPRQQHVLFVLADGPRARNDWAAWYPLQTGQVYSIMAALERKSLVDVAGFANDGARTYKITEKGEQFLPGEDFDLERETPLDGALREA